MRTSGFLLATTRETSADAELASYRLMLRAGFVRRLAAGMHAWLPLGVRVLRKVENLIRAELDRIGAQEVLVPAIQTAELWLESGRWDQFGPELLRLRDRHNREFCLAPSHEEAITGLVRHEIRSYRQLPAIFYQIQTVFRDEIRPRSGMLRARESLVKTACSFHRDAVSMRQTYDMMLQSYARIFTSLGLEFLMAVADNRVVSGGASHEFHVPADAGEDSVAVCSRCRYAANAESAPALPPIGRRSPPGAAMEMVETPGQRSIDEVSRYLGTVPVRMLKTLLVRGSGGIIALVLRGDHEINAIKAEKLPLIAKPLVFVTPEEVRMAAGCSPGSVGPVGLEIPVIADESALRLADFICGANHDGAHLRNVNWGRDLPEPLVADIRNVVEGDPCPRNDGPMAACDGQLHLQRSIKVGHVFELGTRYSAALGATCLDEGGNTAAMTMGCYEIGISRTLAAAAEQHHDAGGIAWPQAIAPFTVCVVPVGLHRSGRVRAAAERLYSDLSDAGIEVLLDDRDERPGVMFADMDLIGITHRVVLGERSLDQGTVEYRSRRTGETRDIPLAEIVPTLRALLGS